MTGWADLNKEERKAIIEEHIENVKDYMKELNIQEELAGPYRYLEPEDEFEANCMTKEWMDMLVTKDKALIERLKEDIERMEDTRWKDENGKITKLYEEN